MHAEQMRLFAIPITKTWVSETAALKQQFLPEMLRRYEAGSYHRPAAWESDRVHTSFAASPKDQVLDPIPEAYERLIRQFVKTEKYSVRLWHSVYWKGGEYEQQHHHIPSHLTIVHFLAFERGEHRLPMFYDPARAIKAYCRHDAVPHEFWSEGEEVEVFEGDALVFPSYVEHHVPPAAYAKPRVTVSLRVTLPDPEG